MTGPTNSEKVEAKKLASGLLDFIQRDDNKDIHLLSAEDIKRLKGSIHILFRFAKKEYGNN